MNEDSNHSIYKHGFNEQIPLRKTDLCRCNDRQNCWFLEKMNKCGSSRLGFWFILQWLNECKSVQCTHTQAKIKDSLQWCAQQMQYKLFFATKVTHSKCMRFISACNGDWCLRQVVILTFGLLAVIRHILVVFYKRVAHVCQQSKFVC